MRDKLIACMKEKLVDIPVVLDDTMMEQFFSYYELLLEWNKVMNLTAITELEEVVLKHFADSLSLIKAVPNLGDQEFTMIDVGTGAGFPGIPLKIAFPNLKITLLDSLNKRIKFLDTVIGQLGLEKIETIHGRAEDFGRDPKYREQYDFAVSRAVANLSTLSEYCTPFVKKDGSFISYKSGKIDEELENSKKAIKLLGCRMAEVTRFYLSDTETERTFVVIKRIEGLSKKYPRKAGLPSKEPLGC